MLVHTSLFPAQDHTKTNSRRGGRQFFARRAEITSCTKMPTTAARTTAFALLALLPCYSTAMRLAIPLYRPLSRADALKAAVGLAASTAFPRSAAALDDDEDDLNEDDEVASRSFGRLDSALNHDYQCQTAGSEA
jgi:hypothetical protein